jgi:hypothetical protein
VSAFLTVGFFALLGQTHDELKSEFIVATTAGASCGSVWLGLSVLVTLRVPGGLVESADSGRENEGG